MDAKNYEYLKDRVDKYQRLDWTKGKLIETQKALVKAHDLKIHIDSDGVNHYAIHSNLPLQLMTEEYSDLFGEIKDNLIDAIGIKIVEIEEKMKEL